MTVLTVGAGQQFARLSDAVAASHDGDVIAVQAGTYKDDFATINTKISIVGVGGMVKLMATKPIPNGKAILVTNTDVSIDHVEFSGATVADGNGAGIRYQGGKLTVSNSYFHDNQEGILGGSVAGGSIVIQGSEFARNGKGDGLTHGVYVGKIANLTITDSYFHDTKVGHHIKSRADSTTIENNRIDDGTGTASYSIDLPNGGAAVVRNNVIVQGAASQNSAIIHFGGEGTAYAGSSLVVTNNAIQNFAASSIGVLNQTSVTAQITNNQLFNVGTLAFGPSVATNNTKLTSAAGVDHSSPWAASTMTDPTTLKGTASGDRLDIGSTVRSIDGGAGNDTAVFSGARSAYTLSKDAAGVVTIIDSVAGGAKIVAQNVESFAFAGGTTLALSAIATQAASGATASSTPALKSAITTTSTTTSTTSTSTTTTALVGTAGNDQLVVSSAIRSIDGGAGNDTAVFSGARSSYVLSKDASGLVSIVDNAAGGVKIVAQNVESFAFAGGTTLALSAIATQATAASTTTPVSKAAISTTPTTSTSALVGTAGNDKLVVSSAIRSVDGAAGTDTAVFSADRSWYKVTGSATGTVTVTDVHATGIAVTLTNVENIQFGTAAAITVAAALTPSTAASPLTSGTSTSGTSTGGTLAAGVLTGSAGNDRLVVSAAVKTVDGAAGTDTAVFSGVRADYSITGSTTGPVTVTNITSTGAIVTVQNVEQIQFGTTTAISLATALTAPTGSLLGTAGNDTLTVTSTTKLVDGGTGSDTVSFSSPFDWYRMASDGHGGLLLTEVHASGQVVDVINAETLKFGNIVYDVATGTTTNLAPVSSSSSGGGSAVPLSTAIVKAPDLADPSHPGDITAVRLENTGDAATNVRTVTFGQVFKAGDLPAGTKLVAIINGAPVEVQLDVKTTYADGSVKHAILSMDSPAMAAHGSVDVMLARGGAATAAHALDISTLTTSGYDVGVDFTFHDASGANSLVHVSAADALSKALAGKATSTWMQGADATEVRVDTAISGGLHARFDIRLNADGTVHTDVSVLNDSTYTAAKTYNYDVKITDHGQTVYSEANVAHYRNATWHKEVWSGGAEPTINVVQDVGYLQATGAIQNYDTSLGVVEGTLDSQLAALAKSDTSLLGSALVTTYMPQTGGRADIGPEPQWVSQYLISQDARAKEVMLANADAAGSVPWHFTDEATGRAVTIDKHPNLWIDDRGTVSRYGTDSLATPYSTTGTGWQTDTAHAPQLTYVPYLLTGTRYYLDELQAQASYELASFDPGYRQGSAGLFYGQVRGLAWGLRDVGAAAFATPDSDVLKSYFTNKVDTNLSAWTDTYLTKNSLGGAGQIEGYFYDSYHPGSVAPWQQDYLSTTLADLAARGFTKATSLLEWQSNFTAGRFISGDEGYDPLHGAGYWLDTKDPTTGALYTTWKQFYDGNFGTAAATTTIDGYADSAGGYIANAKAALADIISATQTPNAIEAYGYLVGMSPSMPAAYQKDPTWDIVPRMADGSVIDNAHTQLASGTTGATLTGGTGGNLLVGSDGGDVLNGGTGTNLLFGGGGNDTLNGGATTDYLFGGVGNDRLNGNAGSNYLKGGAGSDVFAFSKATSAHDVVADFDPLHDLLEVKLAAGDNTTAAALVATVTEDANHNAVIHLGGTHDIVLDGITSAQVKSDWFVMTH